MTRATRVPARRRAAEQPTPARSGSGANRPGAAGPSARRPPAVEIVAIYAPDIGREVSALLLLLARAQVGARALDGLGRERIDGDAPARLRERGVRRITTEE